MAPTALVASGGDHDELLAEIAAGTTRIGIAFGEAIKRRNNAGVTVKDGRMSGTSMYAFDAEANAYLVADQHQHIYLVRADDPGLKRSHLATVDKTRRTVELNYDNVTADLVSDDASVFTATVDIGRMALAADTLGAAQNMLDQAVEYAKQREQFNRPIGSFQAVKHMCAEMAAQLDDIRGSVEAVGLPLGLDPTAHADEARVVARQDRHPGGAPHLDRPVGWTLSVCVGGDATVTLGCPPPPGSNYENFNAARALPNQHAPGTTVVLRAGDALYIPCGVWHEVSSGGGLHAAANYWCHPPDGASFARPYTSSFWADDWARRRRDDPLLKT